MPKNSILSRNTIAIIIFIVIVFVGGGYLVHKQLFQNQNTSFIPNTKTAIKISFVASYQEGKNNTKIKIFKDDQLVTSLIVPLGEVGEGKVWVINDNSVYFSIPPSGLGGYILYGEYTNLYKLNFADNSVDKIMEQDYLTDIDITPEADIMVYGNSKDQIVVKNLNTSKDLSYKLPANFDSSTDQFGSFKFSPNKDKIAVAIGSGWGGKIYILNLASGLYSLYKETTDIPVIDRWLNNNELVWHYL